MAKKPADLKTYEWNESSIIARADIRARNKNAVAYIYAADNNSDEHTLSELRNQFKEKGWATSSDTRNGKSVLRVSGLRNPGELMEVLESGHYTNGEAQTSQEIAKHHQTATQTLKTHSLRTSGILYNIGNAFYVASGIARGKDKAQIGSGLKFAAGDVLLALFGGKDDQRQFASLLTKYKNHLEKQGIDIPIDSALYAETDTSHDSMSDKAYNFIHEHINKIKAGAEVWAGKDYFDAGRNQGNKWKQATAVIFSLGFGSSLIIPEKKPDPEKLENANPAEKAWAFVQEKPLRIAGWSGLSNTLFTTIGAFQERAKYPGRNLYKYDLAAAGSMLGGNSLYALSNKSTGGTITEDGLIRDVYGIAAQVLNRVPEQMRQAAIKSTVDFLGDRIEIKDNREQVDKILREQMLKSSQENRWFKAKSDTLTLPQDVQKQWKNSVIPTKHKQDTWQNIVTRPLDPYVLSPTKH